MPAMSCAEPEGAGAAHQRLKVSGGSYANGQYRAVMNPQISSTGGTKPLWNRMQAGYASTTNWQRSAVERRAEWNSATATLARGRQAAAAVEPARFVQQPPRAAAGNGKPYFRRARYSPSSAACAPSHRQRADGHITLVYRDCCRHANTCNNSAKTTPITARL